MTRRGAIIAALLSPLVGSRGKATSKEPTVYISLEIPEHLPKGPPTYVPNWDEASLTIKYPPLESYDYALKVSYKDRAVYLTGDEIMDALEER